MIITMVDDHFLKEVMGCDVDTIKAHPCETTWITLHNPEKDQYLVCFRMFESIHLTSESGASF